MIVCTVETPLSVPLFLPFSLCPRLCVISLTADGTYSSSGQLTCVACRAPVKSELAWTAHLASRSHREQVVALKGRQGAEKRPAESPAAAAAAKHKRHKGSRGSRAGAVGIRGDISYSSYS